MSNAGCEHMRTNRRLNISKPIREKLEMCAERAEAGERKGGCISLWWDAVVDVACVKSGCSPCVSLQGSHLQSC